MNLPNKLTVMRFVLVPVFMIFVLMPESVMSDTASRCIAAVLFGVTALTDLFDGKIARKYNLVTNFGKFMDPLADKFMIFGALLSIVAKYDDLRGVMVWVAITVMLRELAVTSIRLTARHLVGWSFRKYARKDKDHCSVHCDRDNSSRTGYLRKYRVFRKVLSAYLVQYDFAVVLHTLFGYRLYCKI